tara:strand:+ start:27 stop:266 length:240 start_codon:yes stop_codon:yes gene_type:complete
MGRKSVMVKDKRMYDDVREHGEDMSYENEGSTVTISLKEYDKLRERQKFITDKDMIAVVDKIEELVRALRKHIVRSDFD